MSGTVPRISRKINAKRLHFTCVKVILPRSPHDGLEPALGIIAFMRLRSEACSNFMFPDKDVLKSRNSEAP